MSPQSLARLIAIAVVGGLFWSGISAFDSRWSFVGTERIRYAADPAQPGDLRFMAGLYETSVLEFWRANVHRGDRYYFNVPPSTPSFSDLPSGLSMVAGYALLPAERVLRPEQATVILTSGVDPNIPGLTYSSTVTNAHATVSRVQR